MYNTSDAKININGNESSKKSISVQHNSLNLTSDLANWMNNLPTPLKKLPIVHLAIPGSHDSGSYAITPNSEIAPDLDESIGKLRFLGPLFNYVMSNWTKTQDFNVAFQLKAGVRYLDLRISTKVNEGFYLVHGLFGAPLNEVLEHISEFLQKHPQEIVVIDCQHFFEMTQKDHDLLADLFYKVFGKKIAPCVNNYMKHITLEYMHANHYQILIVYRHPDCRLHKFFPSSSYPTPWPNTTNANKLIVLLGENLKSRNGNVGYVTQFILTPNKWTIIGGICSNLKKFFAMPLLQNKLHWVKEQSPGFDGVNVIIGDFVDANNCEFTRAVINLNHKLLPEEFLHEESHSSTFLPPISD